jgi:hypothetical protein
VGPVDRRPHRPGWLALATAAVMAAAGCIGPNPAFLGVDALGPRGGEAGGSGGGSDAATAGGTGGGPSGGAGGAAGDGGDATGGAATGGAPASDGLPADTSLPPDTAGLDVAPPADTSAPPVDVMAPPPDTSPPVDLPIDLPAVDAARPATSRFNFETSAQGWGDLRPDSRDFPTTSTRMTAPAPAWDGQWAMAIAMRSGTTNTKPSLNRIIGVAQEFRSQLPANTVISYRLYLPAGDALDYIQPFVLYYKPADRDGAPQWGGTDPPIFASDLRRGEWVEITHRVPSNCDSRGVVEVGFEFVLRPSRSLTVYIDGVHW